MNTEEKAKAYDEALIKAKELLDSPRTCFDINQLKDIFPELRESEDERIRRALIDGVRQIRCKNGVTQEQMLAYLEKQKINTEGDFGRGYDCGYEACLNSHGAEWFEKQKEPHYTKRNALFDKCVENCDPKVMKEVSDKVDAMLEKEQKPVDFPTTDEEVKEFLETHPKVEVPEKYKTPDFVFSKQEYESHPIISKDTTSVKPAEWSEDWREEDIQTRFAFYTYKDDSSVLYLSNVFVEEASRNHGFGTRILRAAEKVAETIGAITICLKVKQDSPANAWYRKNGYGYVAFEDGYDWLEKNLEYLKPAKSIEWSEEDRLHYANVLEALEYVKGCKSDYDKIEAVKSDIAWLKLLRNRVGKDSLQPHWKPSEEQMKAFKGYIEDFQARAEAAVGGWNNFDVMIRLYEQLKKL